MSSLFNPTEEKGVCGREKDAFGQNIVVKEELVNIVVTTEGHIFIKKEDEAIHFKEKDVEKVEQFEIKSEDFTAKEDKQPRGVKQEDVTVKEEKKHFRIPELEEDVLGVKEIEEAEDPTIPKVMGVWNEKTEDQLILLIQERPSLYNTEKCYVTKNTKTQLWREIGNAVTISEKELKKRWESLRTQYCRYKRLAASESAGAKRTARQQWLLTRLQFLEPYTKRHKSTSKLIKKKKEPGATDVNDYSDTGNSISQVHITLPEEPITPLEEPSFLKATDCTPLAESTVCGEDSQSEPSSTQRPRGKRSRKTLDVSANEDSTDLTHTLTKTLETLASKRTHDEIANFCKNLETRMRKLSVSRLPYVMNEIENCLFRHVLEDRNQAHYTQL
ncbi:hypothetical protein UPYG_G00053440 [Umbra pygmaea]|uniref:MADF domain-containing protein n=1 Tax=Umbra pygmaea TaxID=75934 RepID=A0ABD0XPR4_UMBPY